MLRYAMCLSYHSNTEAALFACLSSSWAITTGRLFGPKVGNSIKCLSQGDSDALLHRESNLSFATFPLLVHRLYQPVLSRRQKQMIIQIQSIKIMAHHYYIELKVSFNFVYHSLNDSFK